MFLAEVLPSWWYVILAGLTSPVVLTAFIRTINKKQISNRKAINDLDKALNNTILSLRTRVDTLEDQLKHRTSVNNKAIGLVNGLNMTRVLLEVEINELVRNDGQPPRYDIKRRIPEIDELRKMVESIHH